jgi:hypothetical protein
VSSPSCTNRSVYQPRPLGPVSLVPGGLGLNMDSITPWLGGLGQFTSPIRASVLSSAKLGSSRVHYLGCREKHETRV